MLPLDNLKIRDAESGFFERRKVFTLFNPDSMRNVYKDQRSLTLGVSSPEELENWKASFLRAGVFPEKVQDSEEAEVSR